MSRQYSPDMPDATEVAPASKSRKKKPWMLWHKWGRWGWHRHGRYREKDEAQTVAKNYVRRVYGSQSRLPRPEHLFKVLHESEGKPE